MLVEGQFAGVTITIAVAQLAAQVQRELTKQREINLAAVVQLVKLQIGQWHCDFQRYRLRRTSGRQLPAVKCRLQPATGEAPVQILVPVQI